MGDESAEAQTKAEQYAQARTAPGVVLPGAYSAAFASLSGLPVFGTTWTEVTNRPYNSDDPRYRDPFASNSSGGSGLVSGRITGLAVGAGYLFIGGANGGVFRSGDQGQTWTPLTDGMPALSTGDLRLAPDGALWFATGEANTGATAFLGTGVYRLASPSSGSFTVADRVGGTELESTFIGKLRFDGIGNVYAATSRGLWRHSASTKSGAWQRVLYPVADPVVNGVSRPDLQLAYNNICNDVAIQAGSGGQHVLVNCAWRDGAPYNGFYYSTERRRRRFALINPNGALNPQDVGRTTFAYASDGDTALRAHRVDDEVHQLEADRARRHLRLAERQSRRTVEQDRFVGQPRYGELGTPELGLLQSRHPGLVQPVHRRRSGTTRTTCSPVSRRSTRLRTAASHWTTIGPYWNFDFDCWSVFDNQNTCPPTTHPDQHSIAIAGEHRLRRQRRRPVRAAAARRAERATATPPIGRTSTRTCGRCSTTRSRSARCPEASPSPAACRTTADRCCCPKI